jgi:hypothetical protein
MNPSNRIIHQWQKNLFDKLRRFRLPAKISFIILGIVSIIWFLIRVIPKPQRATYPCMRVTAPLASSFVIYILGISGSIVSFKKFVGFAKSARLIPALALLGLAMILAFTGISFDQNKVAAFEETNNAGEPNNPVGIAKGLFSGRVVWVYEPDATNESINNSYTSNHSDAYFSDLNTNQEIVDQMVEGGLFGLTKETTMIAAWDVIFRYHNSQRGKGDVGYKEGEIVFIKINATSSWEGNYDTGDLSRKDNNNYAISETSPQVVTAVLRQLVNVVGVNQSDIYIGDPLKHIYQDIYEKLYFEFPDIHYLDNSNNYSEMGREGVVASSSAIIDYSDRGTILKTGDWSSAEVGDPVTIDNLYTIFDEMEYMINIPTLKGHYRAGVTLFAKNHFGSHTREDAKHLHGGLVEINSDGSNRRNEYGLYRVLVDIMGHKLLGEKNLIYILDALYTSEMEVNQPDKWQKAPWNNSWTSSIFFSQDPVAIESVGFDFLYYEFDGSNGLDAFPHYGAVDDYLHQAASSENWPAGITYDPENDGTIIESLGVHEHWNNPIDMQYSRNLGTSNGIELVKIPSIDDIDNDGFAYDNDCNDLDPEVNPDMTEVPYNGKDDDCDSTTLDDDLDDDGFTWDTDCNDYDPSINPDACDIRRDGIDQDCDGFDRILGSRYCRRSTKRTRSLRLRR